jgi:anti-anti-sigma factor
LQAADPAWRTVDGGVTATVTGCCGEVIATIARRTEQGPAAPDPTTPRGATRIGPVATGADRAIAVVTVDGDIDRDTAPLLAQALAAAIDDQPCTCLDMRHVDVLDAAGVRVLLGAGRDAADRGRGFWVRGLHGVPEQVLMILGVDRLIAARD